MNILNPISQIETRLGIEDGGQFQAYMVSSAERRMSKYVPRDSGNLANTTFHDNNSITYASPYAHYQYIGKLYVMENGKGAYYNPTYGYWSKKNETKTPTNTDLKYKTAGTGSYWDKKMMTAEGKEFIEELQRYINTRS